MDSFKLILTDSLEKILPGQSPRALDKTDFFAFPGETVSFQIAARLITDVHTYSPQSTLCVQPEGDLAEYTSVYAVALQKVMLPSYSCTDDNYITKTACLLPDILMPTEGENTFTCIAEQWSSAWVTVLCPNEPGVHTLKINVSNDKNDSVQSFSILIHIGTKALLPIRFYHTEWFHTDCLADYYNVPVWSDRHWNIIENYMEAASDVGVNMILTPVFTPELDTEIGHERTTTQLVDIAVENGKYRFNFDKLDKWIDLSLAHHFTEFEICHLFSQWGAAFAPKIIANVNGIEKQIFGWESPAVGGDYTTFLHIFIPALKEHMSKRNLLDHTWFHISDEPNMDNFEQWKKSRDSVADLLDGCHVMDAISDYPIYKLGNLQTPVVSEDHIEKFIEENVPGLWTYFCCGQSIDVPNRFIAMPSARLRVLGVLLYELNITGFLQWGLNFYNGRNSLTRIDPWETADGNCSWPAGDPFLFYPGKDGKPIKSIRSMLTKEMTQDLQMLQLAETVVGRENVISALESLFDGKYTMKNYPTDPEWFGKMRKEIYQLIEE